MPKIIYYDFMIFHVKDVQASAKGILLGTWLYNGGRYALNLLTKWSFKCVFII